jgi:hypothetical protein
LVRRPLFPRKHVSYISLRVRPTNRYLLANP